ncbi:hypothetical protein B4064_2051 [Caldibacillus thermoamylovorans]|uniref:Uncharacterized protein n=1 Tax=Caldibacillus thermoamylovorans TaxID=35841 RepID=A0ABD4A384_9BACI|nr:hypothetical protein B4064_2051 [Caldibacillus thermoamylovorans]KIO71431.1 hypothetical protein B4167_3688 [Caldibacillus thermoamylovorans]
MKVIKANPYRFSIIFPGMGNPGFLLYKKFPFIFVSSLKIY